MPDTTVHEHMENYMPFVRSVAWKLHRDLGIPVGLHDELVQCGFVGLLEARKRYCPDHEATFITFAARRVEGEMLDFLRRDYRSIFNAIQFDDGPAPDPVEGAVVAREVLVKLAESTRDLPYRRRKILESVITLQPIRQAAADVCVDVRKALRWRREVLADVEVQLAA